MSGGDLTKQILEIQRDPNLTDEEKAKKRQALMAGKWLQKIEEEQKEEEEGTLIEHCQSQPRSGLAVVVDVENHRPAS